MSVRCQAIIPFFATQNGKKAQANFRGSQDAIDDVHHRIWPGVAIRKLRSKNSLRSTRDDTQDIWFQESTMTTSSFISFITFAISGKHRNTLARGQACSGLSNLVLLMTTSLGGFDLGHIIFGSDNDNETNLHVNTEGSVVGSLFRTREFFMAHIHSTWKSDVRDEKKTWMTRKNGLGQVSLVQLLAFCLDPSHSDTLQRLLVGPVLDILSEFAKILDESVALLMRDADDLGQTVGFKNKTRMANNIKRVWVEAVVKKLWNGEESSPTRTIMLLFLFFDIF